MVCESRGSQSEQENILLNTLDSVVQGRAEMESLIPILQQAVGRLESARQEFAASVEKQPRVVQDTCLDVINSIHRYFDRYEHILSEAMTYAFSCDSSVLEEVIEDVQEVTVGLNREMFLFHQAVWKHAGPTKIPGINLLIYLTRQMQRGEDVFELFREHVSRESTVIDDILVEMDLSPADSVNPSVRKVYEEFFGILEAFFLFFQTLNMDMLDRFIENLERIAVKFEKFHETEDTSGLSEMLEGPTSSPSVNLVINHSRKIRSGELDFSVLPELLHQLFDQVQTMRLQYVTLARIPTDDDRVSSEVDLIGSILEDFEDVLNRYADLLESQAPDELELLENRLIHIITVMDRSRGIFRKLMDQEGKIPCIRCGHYNPSVKKVCEECNFPLPAFSVKEATDITGSGMDFMESGGSGGSWQDNMMTERVKELFDATQSLAEGKITLGDFEKIIVEMEKQLEKAYSATGPVPEIKADGSVDPQTVENIKRVLEEAAELYIQGLEDFESGLVFLRQFTTSNLSSCLQTGIKMIHLGSTKLQKVQKVVEPLVVRG